MVVRIHLDLQPVGAVGDAGDVDPLIRQPEAVGVPPAGGDSLDLVAARSVDAEAIEGGIGLIVDDEILQAEADLGSCRHDRADAVVRKHLAQPEHRPIVEVHVPVAGVVGEHPRQAVEPGAVGAIQALRHLGLRRIEHDAAAQLERPEPDVRGAGRQPEQFPSRIGLAIDLGLEEQILPDDQVREPRLRRGRCSRSKRRERRRRGQQRHERQAAPA